MEQPNSAKIRLVLILSITILLILLSIVFFTNFLGFRQNIQFLLQQPPQQNQTITTESEKEIKVANDQQLNISPTTEEGVIKITGIIQTSGLLQEEKTKLGLKYANYQLTYIQQQNNQTLQGFFIEAKDADVMKYWGKCVEMEGKIEEEWENIAAQNYELNGQSTYNRSVLITSRITEQNNNVCISNLSFSSSNANNSELKELVFTGRIKRSKRPAPDIGYDFEIKLTETNSALADGRGDEAIDTATLIPSSPQNYFEIENNVGGNAEITGFVRWGFAETKYIEVTKITAIN